MYNMYKYNCLNPISEAGLKELDEQYTKTGEFSEADAVFVRSAQMHEMEFGGNLKAIARAGAGVNNIPLDKCAEKGIVVFNTPGANANGVKELVLTGMFLACRDIIGGTKWVCENEYEPDLAKLVEKKKKAFSGYEIKGKKLGVIGLGAIGVLVANAAVSLGMDVYGYDPYLSVDAAWKLSRDIHHAKEVEELYKECDFITIHVPALESTKGMINKKALSMMKNGVVVLNFARENLVDVEAIVEAIEKHKIHRYVTDFPVPEIVGIKECIVIPHLGASTVESEDNCAKMAAQELRDFLENGNITHSVNFPDCSLGKKEGGTRITVLHKNIPNMIGQLTAILAGAEKNISVMSNKSKQKYAYTMLDVEGTVDAKIVNELMQINGVLKVRTI